MSKIKIFALGGLDENGKNMYCFEIDENLFIVEAGLKYPENQNLGIDIEIADYDYLNQNKEKIKGIFITHAHPDTMGAITYIIKDINPPIYATQLTSWIVEDLLKEHKISDYKINRIKDKSIIKFDNIKVHSFKTTHSITHSIGLSFETDQGFIVYASDFIIDFGSQGEYQTDIHKLVDISKKGVLALLCESVGSQQKGFTSPRHKITDIVEPIIGDAKSRIIVSVFTHSVYNIKEIIDVAQKASYRILILNEDLQDLVHKHEKLGMPIVNKSNIASINEINNGNVLVVVSGHGKEIFDKLSQIATGSNELLIPNIKDTFIIASPALPGIEHIAIKAIDDIYRLDSKVNIISSKQVISMHASQEDIKMMVSLLKPKYFIPIKGEFRHMQANANVALDLGISSDNIIVLENGEVITFEDKELLKNRDLIKLNSILIDGTNINDAQGVVLYDRLSLSQDGVIIIGIGLDRKTKQQITTMDIQTRGFIYIKDSEYIITEIRAIVNNIIDKYSFDTEKDFNESKAKIRDSVSKHVQKETGKRPIVLSMIITI